MSARTYSVFGLRIQSNEVIPGFSPAPNQAPIDVVILLGSYPEGLSQTLPPDSEALFVSPELETTGDPCSRVWTMKDGEYYRMLFGDGTDCVVNRKATQIWMCWPDRFTIVDIVPYLQGQVLGLVQRLRGVTCLHASAILMGERAIAVAGPGGAGKSSTAAAFLQMGYPILADDVTSIFEESGQFMVRPAHSRVWLKSDMVENLFGDREALPLFAPSWDKRYLDLNVSGPGLPAEPKPLAAIYVLSDRANEPERPLVTEEAPRDALHRLLCNTYMNHLLDPRIVSLDFDMLRRLQEKVPVRIVHPHEDASRISLLCDAICADLDK